MKQATKKKVIRVFSWIGFTQAVAVGVWVEFNMIVNMLVNVQESIQSFINNLSF